MEFQNIITNIIQEMNELKNKVALLEEQLENSNMPIQFKNYYYNNFPYKDRHILSESKIMIDMNNEIGLNIFNKIMFDITNPDLYFLAKQQTQRLFNDMEFFDSDYFDFINNNNEIIVPKNKVIKVWYNKQNMNNDMASIFYNGTYNSNIFNCALVIWMGSIEYIDELPNKL